MKAISARLVTQQLRRLGFRPARHGNGTGHERWINDAGLTCQPVLRRKDVPLAYLFSLGQELEKRGVCTRQHFLAALR